MICIVGSVGVVLVDGTLVDMISIEPGMELEWDLWLAVACGFCELLCPKCWNRE